MNRGERVASRTKSAIKDALLELIKEMNYQDITVANITKTGNIGRSTFYRHYRSKADVHVDIHNDMFKQLFADLSTAEKWLNPKPTKTLVSFLERHQRLGNNPFSLSYKLGNDLDYLINNINLMLTRNIENKLRQAFAQDHFCIPLPVLAQSVSSAYSGLIMSWFVKFNSIDAHTFATYMHEFISALVQKALDDTK